MSPQSGYLYHKEILKGRIKRGHKVFIGLREQLIASLLPAIKGAHLFSREYKYLKLIEPFFFPPNVEELLIPREKGSANQRQRVSKGSRLAEINTH